MLTHVTSIAGGGTHSLALKEGVEENSFVKNPDNLCATIFTRALLLPEGKKCKVFDIAGRVVMPDKMRPGIYFVENDGKITRKVVKVR